MAASFVVPGPAGVSIRARLRVSETDAAVLAEVGAFLGGLAAGDLVVRSRQGLDHDAGAWAARKRELTGVCSARWAGSITKATHDQWALARRGQIAEMAWLRGQITSIEARLARPLGATADKREGLARGYGSRAEWHAKSRRLHALRMRLADWAAGWVRVVRGGKQLARLRHHLGEAGLDEQGWRERWRAARMFLAADGESGKRFGNETIRITDTGQVSLKLPAALARLANAPHGRYVLDATVVFAHRGQEWLDRITANRAVAYRIHHDVVRGRWYVTASWQRTPTPVLPLEAALARGVVAIDMNDDHLAAWRLDVHGNPGGRAPPLLLRPERLRSAPGRADPARAVPAAAPHSCRRGGGGGDRGPGLHRRQVPGEARPQQTLPQSDLPLPHCEAEGPAGGDGRPAGHRGRRGRSRLHLTVGRPALAAAPDQQ